MDPTPTSPNTMAARSAEPVAAVAGERSALPGRREEEPTIAADAEPDAIDQEIRTHLGEGRYRTAQRLAKRAAARFPDHPGIRTMNRGLNEWRAATRPATGRDLTEEYDWLRNPPESARGKWVALIGSEMVAAADSLAEVMADLKSMQLPKTALVHRLD